jgi:hypothetical protein
MPPEVTGEDYGSDFAPGDRPISSSVLGLVNSVKLGFGFPDIKTGGIRDGYSIEGSSSQLKFNRQGSDGSTNETFRMTSEGAMWFTVLAGDPTTPDSGQMSLYAKAGGMYQKDSSGVVTALF